MGSKVIKSLIKCAASGAMLTLMYSCTQEPFSEKPTGTTDPEGMVRVGLYTNAGDYQVPVSRASANEGLDAVSMPWVFVFTGNGDAAIFAEVKQATLFGDISCVMLKPQISAVRLLIIANAPQTFFNGTTEVAFTADNLKAALTAKTFSMAVNNILNTAKLISPVNTVPYVPQLYIPMTEICDIAEGINLATTIGMPRGEIKLTRSVAKVTVENSAANFLLSSASVAGAKQYGRLYKTATAVNIAGNNIDYAPDIAGATGSVGEETTLESPIYIYESPFGEASVIVKGAYKGTTSYYKLAFKDPNDGSIMAVVRNKWYQFKITSVSGAGCLSFADAAAGSPSNVITSSITVIDQGSYDMTDNGLYYVGLSNSALEIVANRGIDYEFTAVTVTTDATQTTLKGVNSVSISGEGLRSCSATSLNLASGSTPGVTEIKIRTNSTTYASLGEITIKLGNIAKVIPVRYAGYTVTAAPSNVFTTAPSGIFNSLSIDPASSSWLSLVIGDQNYTDFTNPTYNSSISFNFKTEPNFGSTTTRREGIAYVSRASGRTKYYVVQNALDPSKITPTFIPKGYVGTFHKWDQTGERVIRMTASYGAWSATVLEGDFIIVDKETLGRSNTNDNTALTGVAEDNQLRGNSTHVIGYGGTIYFRVGLTGRHPSGSEAGINGSALPRYGLILVTYSGNTSYHLIYVRQGEAADYLMRNIAADNPPKGSMINELRTQAQRISPYNLTDPQKVTGEYPVDRGTRGYGFTDYPSQAGYFFQWYQTRAWDPFTTLTWSNPSVTNYVETCPAGYRRVSDNTTASASEFRQSLYLNPLDNPADGGVAGDVANSVWGYLADGFFDRGTITTSSTGAVSSTVSPGTVDVAYVGNLFYNKNNNASVFFPAAGSREGSTSVGPLGKLNSAGATSYYWSGTSTGSGGGWAMMITYTGFVNQQGPAQSYGFLVRCVKNPPLPPS